MTVDFASGPVKHPQTIKGLTHCLPGSKNPNLKEPNLKRA